MGLAWETSFAVFLILTVIIGGGAAWLTGRAMAVKWRPFWMAAFYTVLLAAALRFFHFALFEGTLLSIRYYVADAAVLLAATGAGYYLKRSRQMITQYGWLYERRGLFGYRKREKSGEPAGE
jgi:phosphatidylglycerophosphate synthase